VGREGPHVLRFFKGEFLRGSAEGDPPLQGVWGCPPVSLLPPRLGEPEGVEKWLIANFDILKKHITSKLW
jgi:hypothetical protein